MKNLTSVDLSYSSAFKDGMKLNINVGFFMPSLYDPNTIPFKVLYRTINAKLFAYFGN